AASRFIGPYLTKHSSRFIKFATGLGVVNKLPKKVKRAYFLPYQTRQRRQAIWDFVEDIPFDSTHPSYADMLDLAERIPQLSHIPVQIVWGLKDPCFHREMLSKVAEHFPQARILELPKASHLLFEDGSEQACKAIESFLSKSEAEVQSSMKRELAGNKHGPANILYQKFLDCVQAYPDQHAVIMPRYFGDRISYAQWSYRDLNRLINKYQRGLSKLGLKPGYKVLMLVSPGVEFVALSLAVMGRGAIPVYLDPGMGKEKLEECITQLQPDVFIGSPKAQLLRLVNKKIFSSVKVTIQASEWGIFGGTSLSFLKKFAAKPLPHVRSQGTVLVGYTSGATGTPKGVVYTNTMVAAQLEIFRKEFNLQPGGKDLPLLPLFSLFNVSLGVCSVFPPVNPAKPLALDPSKITNILIEQQITYSFGSPTLWKKIAEYCVRSRKKLSYLKKVFIAGAPVPAETLELVRSVLAEGEAYTPYGATEALPVSLISASQLREAQPKPAESGEQGTLVGSSIP
ncbi:MAG: AMP-binding protein, partial [Bdellovibrionales bacterium]|nr:AMP-binding protein [Bdellovibrionales bacterium]